jgi:type II secretory pathway pseudopilin PulG
MIRAFRRGTRMRYAESLRAPRHNYLAKCVAITAVILLITSAAAAQAAAGPEVQGLDELKKNPALMTEFGQLMKKLQQSVQSPPERSASRLLPLLPESTVFYAALPNFGDASHQALAVFQQEVKENSDLRAWWEHVAAADGPKVEESLEKFYQLSQYLGDEIVVSGAKETGKDPSLLILAEARKPGLKDFLQQAEKELAGKSNPKPFLRVLNVQELAAAKDTPSEKELAILVRPDFVVGALDVAALRSFNARLDLVLKVKGSGGFASTPFGQRLAQAYEGGVTEVGAADLQTILQQVPTGSDQNRKSLQLSGFGEVKYFVWEHKKAGGQVELSFTGPRHGAASWLASPGPLGSLDFVSPKAVIAASVRLKSPAEILDDVQELASVSNPNAPQMLAQMQQGLKLSLKDDLLSYLGGEITLELDSLSQTNALWKVILQVNHPERLQTTLSTLLATAKIGAEQSVDDGVTYHTLRIPSGPKTTEISYAFADGYLVVASSREIVSEAVRLHRSGEALGKSKKFLASLPPGHLAEVSALLYEDPIAMAAMNLRRISPDLADSISQVSGESTPVAVCAYGEESAIREVSRSGGVDVGVILVGAAIAIPNLLRAKIAANESSAVAMIRTANTAQVMYASSYPQKGFARDLAALGPDSRDLSASSADHANFIDATLGNASCTASAWCAKSGFQFRITAACKKQRCDDYVVVATPASSNTGSRNFCSTSDAVIRARNGPPLTSPVSVAQCKAWAPLQ